MLLFSALLEKELSLVNCGWTFMIARESKMLMEEGRNARLHAMAVSQKRARDR